MNKKLHLFIFLSLMIVCFFPVSKGYSYQNVELVKTDSDIEFWLVEDHSVPVIALNFAFAGGIAQDPVDKMGRANMLASMLGQGADDIDENTFQEMLADYSIGLSFNARRDAFTGALKTLSKYKEKGAELLEKTLTQPHFKEETFERIKQDTTTSLRQKQTTPMWLLWRNFNDFYYQDHPYTKPSQGTLETIEALTIDDLNNFMDDYFAKENLKISIVGDISIEEAKAMVDDIFSSLQEESQYSPIEDFSRPLFDEEHHVELDIPQTFLLMGRPGLDESDPDWAAVVVSEYLIGGGSFNSLLMEKARTEKSLTYGISSSLLTQKYADLFIIQTSMSRDKYDMMTSTITDTLNEALRDGFSHEKIEAAKAYLIGSLPLSLTTTQSIAQTYLNLQLNDLPATYLEERAENIKAVTQNDIRRATARLLGDLSFTRITVGKMVNEEETSDENANTEESVSEEN